MGYNKKQKQLFLDVVRAVFNKSKDGIITVTALQALNCKKVAAGARVPKEVAAARELSHYEIEVLDHGNATLWWRDRIIKMMRSITKDGDAELLSERGPKNEYQWTLI